MKFKKYFLFGSSVAISAWAIATAVFLFLMFGMIGAFFYWMNSTTSVITHTFQIIRDIFR